MIGIIDTAVVPTRKMNSKIGAILPIGAARGKSTWAPKRDVYKEKLRDTYVEKLLNHDIQILDSNKENKKAKAVPKNRLNKTGEYRIAPVDHKAAALKLEKIGSMNSPHGHAEILMSLRNISDSKTSFVKHMVLQRNLVSQQSVKNGDI